MDRFEMTAREPLFFIHTREGSMFDVKIPLGPEILEESQGYCRLVFDVGEVSTAIGNDLRPLGAAVSRLDFKRVG